MASSSAFAFGAGTVSLTFCAPCIGVVKMADTKSKIKGKHSPRIRSLCLVAFHNNAFLFMAPLFLDAAMLLRRRRKIKRWGRDLPEFLTLPTARTTDILRLGLETTD